MSELTRRSVLVGAGGIAGAAALEVLQNRGGISAALAQTQRGESLWLQDASGLDPIRVAKHLIVTQDPGDHLVEIIRREIAEARRDGRAIVASAARHSMGGQSLAEDGTALTLHQQWLELDRSSQTFRAGAGTRWSSVIARLDAEGFSPAVMQSNNDFSVAGTFCVNAHGWPVPFGPFGSTVRSLRMVLADGTLVTCSRTENTDLFVLAMGGYGLSGVIVDLVAEMVPNAMLRPSFEPLAPEAFADAFREAVESGDVQMAYGRVDVSTDNFLGETLMATYRPIEAETPLPQASGSGIVGQLSRSVYRSQTNSDRFKQLRWWIERELGPQVRGDATRNSLMNEPVATLANRDTARTDILQEYFVPPDRFGDFAQACREVVPASYQDLLNVTLRYVRADQESVLSYAPAPRIAAVMSFTQERSERAEQDMLRLTRALVDRVIELGGSYYLPYRLHASDAQFARAYPRSAEFAQRKWTVDPEERFGNAFWQRYLRQL